MKIKMLFDLSDSEDEYLHDVMMKAPELSYFLKDFAEIMRLYRNKALPAEITSAEEPAQKLFEDIDHCFIDLLKDHGLDKYI